MEVREIVKVVKRMFFELVKCLLVCKGGDSSIIRDWRVSKKRFFFDGF